MLVAKQWTSRISVPMSYAVCMASGGHSYAHPLTSVAVCMASGGHSHVFPPTSVAVCMVSSGHSYVSPLTSVAVWFLADFQRWHLTGLPQIRRNSWTTSWPPRAINKSVYLYCDKDCTFDPCDIVASGEHSYLLIFEFAWLLVDIATMDRWDLMVSVGRSDLWPWTSGGHSYLCFFEIWWLLVDIAFFSRWHFIFREMSESPKS